MASLEMYNVLDKLRELDSKKTEAVADALDNTEKMNGEQNIAEAKPDFLDLDKDGNKKEPMKKAAKDAKKKKVDEAITITADTPEEASAIQQMMALAGLTPVTPDMMPGQDNVPMMKSDDSINGSPCGCDEPEYENTPDEHVKGVEDVTVDAGIDGVNGKKAPQDIRVKDPSPYEDFQVRLKDLAGIEQETEEGWDNEPDEHYKDYDADEYADKAGHASRKTHQVPAKSGDNPLENIEQSLLKAYADYVAEENSKKKIEERPLTNPEEKAKEKYVKGMKKSDSFEKYKDPKAVMYATATKMAKKNA